MGALFENFVLMLAGAVIGAALVGELLYKRGKRIGLKKGFQNGFDEGKKAGMGDRQIEHQTEMNSLIERQRYGVLCISEFEEEENA